MNCIVVPGLAGGFGHVDAAFGDHCDDQESGS